MAGFRKEKSGKSLRQTVQEYDIINVRKNRIRKTERIRVQ